jgi:restriction system protein
MVASLLLIAALSPSTATVPPPVVAVPVVTQATYRPEPAYVPRPSAAPITRAQATIYASGSQNDADLREWKKRNAESMKILEKTTKEMPLR